MYGDVGEALDRVREVVRRDLGELDVPEVVTALTLLHQLRSELSGWEPELIGRARELGASWAELAPALGVASRQAAERRYLRLRPSEKGGATGEQRVRAVRDQRAGDRAVGQWARDNSATLRGLAGEVGAVRGLSPAGQRSTRAVHRALAADDATALLPPLAEARRHLAESHPELAERIDSLSDEVDQLRRSATTRRRGR
ncbi:hypothetical protein SAMN05421810_103162 [Amycolatopsis arida]|uniref:HSP18 transcriptional regulator n=1 Tax=Amycolatopsis arida TaxID=587909 RepID=A0A1I5SJW4_9PSEU|nr:hypothetical protein CLV69_103596 [Amycolatopsis arida]SFP71003.1 hypothetical protein SAMN05421810_103162 [Amycolatopsis arida]